VMCNLHSVELARAYCDRLVGMAAGRVVFDGVPSALTERASRELYGMDADRAPNEAEHGFAGTVAGALPAT
jgi:phosphonate transport system ATP-binding protein